MRAARTLAIVVLLLFYGAVGARQPAVRTSAPLGIPAATLAQAISIETTDRGRLLLDVVRVVFDAPDGQDAADAALRQQLAAAFAAPRTGPGDTVPLPLDPSIWRETILRRAVPDKDLVAAILSERNAALLYHGLAALDDETLGALGPDRETLLALSRHAGAFATFGRSLRIHAGRVAVPGGDDAAPLWQELVGAEPANPGSFTRKLFASDTGRLAFFFDALTHLDPAHQRFALGASLRGAARLERVRALLEVFEQTAIEWRPDERPFMRPPFDPAITLSLLAVTDEGTLAPPSDRSLWTQIFRHDDGTDPVFTDAVASDAADTSTPVDAAWLVSRVHRAPAAVGRRRLNALLFAQRTLAAETDPGVTATAIRGALSFPSLLVTLERMHVPPALMVRAAKRAHALDQIRDDAARRTAIVQFQAALGLLARVSQNHGLPPAATLAAVGSLVDIELSQNGYEGRLARWLRGDIARATLPAADDVSEGASGQAPETLEDAILAAMAGATGTMPGRSVEWEGHAYRADPARAEMRRLQRVREIQRGIPLDAAVAAVLTPAAGSNRTATLAQSERVLADALTSILYAAYLGDPEGPALNGGDVAKRHELGYRTGTPPRLVGVWRLPAEEFRPKAGWHVTGSLLGLDVALSRLSLRRLDTSTMPKEPRLSTSERQTMTLTLALLNPHEMTDAGRTEIAAAIGRGRARLATATADRDDVERLARAAGLSEWRREALAWTTAHDPARVPSQLSLLELFWLGAPRPSEAAPFDPWGAVSAPLTGCVCLQMPKAQAWEELGGRPANGIMATRGADVALLAAETLAALDLPASIAPDLVAFALQDVIDAAQPAYFDDWSGFSDSASAIGRDRMIDYISALTAAGPLVPVRASDRGVTRP